MYRKLTAAIIAGFAAISLSAQIYDPVSWDFRYQKNEGNSYDLVFTASIEEGSHIYAMDIPKGGPIPTSFAIDSSENYVLEGKPYEVTKPEEVMDEAFGFKIRIYNHKAEFRQKITAKKPDFTVKGVVGFMSCNNSTCSPPREVEFEIVVGEKKNTAVAPEIKSAGTDVPKQSTGILSFFIASFLLGLLGVITPCVYPMIPMTVAFFTR